MLLVKSDYCFPFDRLKDEGSDATVFSHWYYLVPCTRCGLYNLSEQ